MMTEVAPPREVDVSLTASDGAPLLARLFTVPGPRGILVIAHGFGEHGGAYRHVAEGSARSAGIDVLAFDFRGHGRSGGRRGVARRHIDLTLDLGAALGWASAHRPGLPRFVLGHSNGGLVSILGVLGADLGLAGLILTNPALRLTADAPAWKIRVGRVLERFAPWVTLKTGIPHTKLTNDPGMLASIRADPLRHRRISAPMYFGMNAAGPVAIERAPEIGTPTLLLLGGADGITDPEAGRLFFDRLASPDKTLRFLPEMRHEILNESGREEIIGEIAGWIEGRLPVTAAQPR